MAKRICIISSEYPPETGFGGIGTYSRIMAHALSERGHDVTVIALSEQVDGYERMDGSVRVVRVSAGKYPLPQGKLFWRIRMLAYRFLPHSLIRMAFAVSVAEAFERISKEKKFDVVEAADCGAESYYLRLTKETKLIIRLHTPYSFSLKFNNQGIGWIDRKQLEIMEKRCTLKADCVTSPTEALASYLIREWNIKRVVIFPNPIDRFNMPIINRDVTKDLKYIAHAGRIEYRKGTHLLIKAYAELVKMGVKENLLIIGRSFGSSGVKGFSYEKTISDLIKNLGLSERVEWVHGLPRNELLKELENVKVAVFPAIWDNYPYAALEMMASGIPVVAFNSGGFPEMVRDGKDGLLAKVMDYRELAEKIKKFIDSDEYANALSISAKDRVLKICDAVFIAEKNEEVYEQ